jgi:hypothetical protein
MKMFNEDQVLQILDSYRQNINIIGNTSTKHLLSWWNNKKIEYDEQLERNSDSRENGTSS